MATREEVIIVCATVAGEQYAQVDNPDPFAPPVWRSPVYRTPEWVIWLVQLVRLLCGWSGSWSATRCWTWRRRSLVLAWWQAGLARPGRPGGVSVGVAGRAAAVAAGLVRPAGHGPGPVTGGGGGTTGAAGRP